MRIRRANAADYSDEEIFKGFGDRLNVIKQARKEAANLEAHTKKMTSVILDMEELEKLLLEAEEKWISLEKTVRE